jgi:hypothetical protein
MKRKLKKQRANRFRTGDFGGDWTAAKHRDARKKHGWGFGFTGGEVETAPRNK